MQSTFSLGQAFVLVFVVCCQRDSVQEIKFSQTVDREPFIRRNKLEYI